MNNLTLERTTRRLPVGAECLAGGVSFRVWAPERKKVVVCLGDRRELPLKSEAGGYFSGLISEARPGDLYRFRLDEDQTLYPDPASRFQPAGPHGPSQVIDPYSYAWADAAWAGIGLDGLVLYEMHIGTFTQEGTWAAAAEKLGSLAEIGVTAIELLPASDFSGEFGWGYDGVNLFAPMRLYGDPDDFRRFVDKAHAVGIGVILDVVYNHFGPDGNYIACFSHHYVTDRYQNEWGEAINFDGAFSRPVRDFFISNVRYWIEEFHLDGLRIDATQALFDQSEEHIIKVLARTAREAGRGRSILVIGESEPQTADLMRPAEIGGYGLDALWADDFHHSAMVAMTGRNEAYYTDHVGAPQEFVSAAKYGYLFQGQYYRWQEKGRGTPAFDIEPRRFINYLQNHDQIANSGRGLRFHLLTDPGRARAITALLLLGPQTPLLFQGQEFWSSAPFHFFADFAGELGEGVRKGRAEFVGQFASIGTPEMQARLSDPTSQTTFEECKLDWDERKRKPEIVALHRDLLRLRREFGGDVGAGRAKVDGAVIGPEAFLLRYFQPENRDILLIFNFGRDMQLATMAEPLLAAPVAREWDVIWSSEDPVYGGSGNAFAPKRVWRVAGHAALALRAEPTGH